MVDVRWVEVPTGVEHATLTVSGPDNSQIEVRLPLHHPAGQPHGFVETGGVVAIEA